MFAEFYTIKEALYFNQNLLPNLSLGLNALQVKN